MHQPGAILARAESRDMEGCMFDRGRVVCAALVLTLLVACRASGGLGSGLPAQSSGADALGREAIPGVAFHTIGPAPLYYGYDSGKVNAFAVDPTNPKIIYVASGRGTGLETYSSAGAYRTSDGGKTWKAIVAGLTDSNGLTSSVINALWIDPHHPSVILAASEYDGIFRSEDGGSNWRNVYRTFQVTQFASLGTAVFAATAAGLLSSHDDGAAWSIDIPAKVMQPTAFGAAVGSGTLVAGATNGSIYTYADATWTRVGRIPFTPTNTDGSTAAIHQMTVDPFAPSTIYASTNDGVWDQSLFTSTDGGRSWAAIPSKYYSNDLGAQALAFSYVHKHLLYVGTDGALLTMEGTGTTAPRVNYTKELTIADIRDIWTQPNGKDDACWIASDQGLVFVSACSKHKTGADVWLTGPIGIGLARHFAISPDGQTILASLQDLSSHVSFDGGKKWVPDFSLYEDGFNEFRPGNPSACYVLDEDLGFSISTDGCKTFPKRPPTFECSICSSRLMTAPIAFDPANPLVMYVLTGEIIGVGFQNTVKGAFRSADGGKTLTKLPWPFVEPGTIIVDPNNGAHIVVSDIAAGRSSLWTTSDGGLHWTRAKGAPSTAFWYTAAISPSNGLVVLASSVDHAGNAYVVRSVDGGRTFAKTPFTLSVPFLRGRVDADRFESRSHRDDDDDRTSPPPAFVYDPVREIRFNQDAPRGSVPGVVLTTLRGAFISDDQGSSWTRIDKTLIAHSFWGIRWVKGYLYLASDGQGIVRSNAPVQR
jgi:photosystem II stability/assembly factor-like uncharacterized protein